MLLLFNALEDPTEPWDWEGDSTTGTCCEDDEKGAPLLGRYGDGRLFSRYPNLLLLFNPTETFPLLRLALLGTVDSLLEREGELLPPPQFARKGELAGSRRRTGLLEKDRTLILLSLLSGEGGLWR